MATYSAYLYELTIIEDIDTTNNTARFGVKSPPELHTVTDSGSTSWYVNPTAGGVTTRPNMMIDGIEVDGAARGGDTIFEDGTVLDPGGTTYTLVAVFSVPQPDGSKKLYATFGNSELADDTWGGGIVTDEIELKGEYPTEIYFDGSNHGVSSTDEWNVSGLVDGSITSSGASNHYWQTSELDGNLVVPTQPGPNYIVEGTDAGDLIDATYADDPNGDMIDNNDGNPINPGAAGGDNDSIVAGAGNDTVLAGAGDDTVSGGTGDDLICGDDDSGGGTGTGGSGSVIGSPTYGGTRYSLFKNDDGSYTRTYEWRFASLDEDDGSHDNNIAIDTMSFTPTSGDSTQDDAAFRFYSGRGEEFTMSSADGETVSITNAAGEVHYFNGSHVRALSGQAFTGGAHYKEWADGLDGVQDDEIDVDLLMDNHDQYGIWKFTDNGVPVSELKFVNIDNMIMAERSDGTYLVFETTLSKMQAWDGPVGSRDFVVELQDVQDNGGSGDSITITSSSGQDFTVGAISKQSLLVTFEDGRIFHLPSSDTYLRVIDGYELDGTNSGFAGRDNVLDVDVLPVHSGTSFIYEFTSGTGQDFEITMGSQVGANLEVDFLVKFDDGRVYSLAASGVDYYNRIDGNENGQIDLDFLNTVADNDAYVHTFIDSTGQGFDVTPLNGIQYLITREDGTQLVIKSGRLGDYDSTFGRSVIDVEYLANNLSSAVGSEVYTISGIGDVAGAGAVSSAAVAGNDFLEGDAGNDTLEGKGGNDYLDGGVDADTVLGGEGSDTIALNDSFGNDSIEGGEDTDGLDVDVLDMSGLTSGADIDLSAVDATDPESGTVTVGADTATFVEIEEVVATDFDDTITGSDGDDSIDMGEGADTIDAGEGDDEINLGDQDGDADVVTLENGDGDDTLTGVDGPVPNPDGSFTPVDTLDVTGLTDPTTGDPVTTDDVTITTDPVTGTVITFPDGTSVTLPELQAPGTDPTDPTTEAWLNALGIPSTDPTPDGVVDGEETGEEMGLGYNDAGQATDGGGDEITTGADSIEGNGGDDTIDGDAGDDTIDGGADDDSIDGGSGDDNILGGTGSDTIDGGDGADVLDGGAGDDDLIVGAGDVAAGGSGDDEFTIDPTGVDGDVIAIDGGTDGTDNNPDDTANGDDGDILDLSDATTGVDITFGTDPEDGTVNGLDTDAADDITFAEIEKVVATDNDDVIDGSGSTGPIDVDAGGGDDEVTGGSGDDTIDGGDGADTLDGGEGDDEINLGDQDGVEDVVVLEDGDGDDTLTGVDGPIANPDGSFTPVDMLDVSGLTDPTTGDPVTTDDVTITKDPITGAPTLTFPDGTSVTLPELEAPTTDPTDPTTQAWLEALGIPTPAETGPDGIVDGEETGEFMTAGYDDANGPTDGGGDVITGGDDSIRGNGGDDIIDADDGNDTVDGGDDNDLIFGAGGDDNILGGSGTDTVYGGEGADIIDGGDGDDDIFFAGGDDASGGSGDDVFEIDTTEDLTDAITIDGGTDGTSGNSDDASNGDDGDTLDLSAIGTGVDITFGPNPESGKVNGLDADTDDDITFSEIENVIATDQDDTIDAGASVLPINVDAGGGDDEVTGGLGDDTIDGGDGADTIEGGAGDDSINLGDEDGVDDVVVLENGAGDDTIDGMDAPTDNGDGTYGPTDTLDVSGLTDPTTDEPVTTEDVTITTDPTTGDPTLSFPDGTSVTLTGLTAPSTDPTDPETESWLNALGVPSPDAPLNYIVEGTDGGELIDATYTGDPEGDMVDANDNQTGTNDDSIDAGAGDDTIIAGAGDDTIRADEGDDVVEGGDGSDEIYGFEGSDTVDGGDGNDLINTRTSAGTGVPDIGYIHPTDPSNYSYPSDTDPDNDRDSVIGGAGNDTILTGDDADTIDGGTGADVIDAGFDADTVLGGSGNDSIQGGEGADTIDGGDDDDVIYGGISPLDPNYAELSNYDVLDVDGDTNTTHNSDSLVGGAGNDRIYGQDDSDTLEGGTGNDTLDGGIDNDLIDGGAGDDNLTGGQGDDKFIFDPDGNDTITDFGAGITGDINDGNKDNNDFVDLEAYYNDLFELRADFADDGVLNQSVVRTNYKSDFDGSLTLDGISKTDLTEDTTNVVCFTRGTMIKTIDGERAIEDLRQGDLVWTKDDGFQPIQWIGSKALDQATLEAAPKLRPVRIKAGAMGRGLPKRDLIVSPQHRVLVNSKIVQRMTKEDEVLVSAKHLLQINGVDYLDADGVEYFHFLFDKHQIVLAEGTESESLFTGPEALAAVEPDAREEILEIFPELASMDYDATITAVRPILSGRQSRKLTVRHVQNRKALLM